LHKEETLDTPRKQFINALENRPTNGRVPHFELVFYLTMESFGKIHPLHRNYSQWGQMSSFEQKLHRNEIADIYIMTAERFEHNAIFIHTNPDSIEETIRLIDIIREKTGNRYFIMRHGDATFSIPDGSRMKEFSYRLIDDRKSILAEAEMMVNQIIKEAEVYQKYGGLDGYALCSDYCFNSGPFISPLMFSEVITPFLARLTKAYRDMGFYVIKHTDGNIMPILDQLVETNPHAIHSLDPQGGVDIAEVKRKVGNRVCIIGNVNCGLMDTGTDEEVINSAKYAIQNGNTGGGYIFSTSNCIYPGMKLNRYELILDVWRNEGNYTNILI